MKHRLIKVLPPGLGVLVLVGIVIALHGALRKIGPGDVLAALAATSVHEILHALGLLAFSVCLMMAYDIPGILFARRLVSFPPLKLRQVALASFCAYALSHVLGAPALSAAAIRLRLYAQWLVPAVGIGRIVALSGSMFTIGLATLLGVLLLLHPSSLPLFGHAVSPAGLRAGGAVLVALVVFYVGAAGRVAVLRVFGRQLTLPGWRLALAQAVLGFADTATSGAILYTVLPDTPGLSYPHVLGIYLAAFAGGIFSGLPGGVGVFDSVLLLGLSDYLPPATALGAILLFRVMYFLAPACAAALCYAGHEVWANMRKRR